MSETFSEHIGVRVTPTMLERFRKLAKKNHMPTAIWVRWVLLNEAEKTEKPKK